MIFDSGSISLFNMVRDRLEDDTLMLVLPVIEKRYVRSINSPLLSSPILSSAFSVLVPQPNVPITIIIIITTITITITIHIVATTSCCRVEQPSLDEDMSLASSSDFGMVSRSGFSTSSPFTVASPSPTPFVPPSEAFFLPNRLYSVISCRNVGGFELVLLHSPWQSNDDCWTGKHPPSLHSFIHSLPT